MTEGEPAGAGGSDPAQPWADAPAEASGAAADNPAGEDGGAARARPRRGRRALLLLVVLLTITGLVWGGMAYLDHRRDVQHRKEVAARLAAERKAEAAYVAALRPLALRVFDVVQPVQDVYDAYAHPRPGLNAARDDVIRHGGARRELDAIKLALSRLHPPKARLTENTDLVHAVDNLVNAFTSLEQSTHDKPDAHGYIESYGWAFAAFGAAEGSWRLAMLPVQGAKDWPYPTEKRLGARGRDVATPATYIMQSDLICGKASDAVEFEDFKHPDRTVRSTFPRLSKTITTAVAGLRQVRRPPTQRPVQHRLEIGWSATLEFAKQLDAVTAAYRRQDDVAYRRAYKHLLEALAQMEDLGRAYLSQGVTTCALFFSDGRPDDTRGPSRTA